MVHEDNVIQENRPESSYPLGLIQKISICSKLKSHFNCQ